MSVYGSDDGLPNSPGLVAVTVKSKPSPSPPPPFLPRKPSPPRVSRFPPSQGKRSNRVHKTKPSPGDIVLVGLLDPNRPDIARIAGEEALNSQSEHSDSDEDMDRSGDEPDPETHPNHELIAIARLAANAATRLGNSRSERTIITNYESGVYPLKDIKLFQTPRSPRSSEIAPIPTPISPSRPHTNGLSSLSPKTDSERRPEPIKPDFPTPRRSSEGQRSINGFQEGSVTTSPNLRVFGSPDQKLPEIRDPTSPLKERSNGSPDPDRTLPGFRQLSELAAAASTEQEARVNGAHRHSISSLSGHSPTLITRLPANGQARSPTVIFPSLNQTSPISMSSEMSPHGLGLSPPNAQSLGSHPFFASSYRRQSAASETTAQVPPTLTPASTESFSGTEGYGSSNHVTPVEHRMSLDGATQQSVGPAQLGSFKCEHAGCIAPPFQTQYLLNSHANVHSQNRPHYCPVPNCPRGEGGKGFKRKNEMIRHGLVHDSPGYVCPFCPDREHKYPRPDNLQRHVRVHHVDKDKDDPALREVLAQRPEGGNRGRRRRAGAPQ